MYYITARYPNGERRKNKAVPGLFGTRVNVKRLVTRCESSYPCLYRRTYAFRLSKKRVDHR